MLIKSSDTTPAQIRQLEQAEVTETDALERVRIHQVLGRMRANTTSEPACRFLNDNFADSRDWLLLHDVRLEADRKQIHANHILIDRGLRFYWLDTRYIDCGLTVHANGSCSVQQAGQNRIHSTQIASPLNKLQKDLRTFKTIVRKLQTGLGWSGLIKPPIVKGFILTNPAIRNVLPREGTIDTSSVVCRDALFPLIWKSREGENGFWSRTLSDQYLDKIAALLLQYHRPLVSADHLPASTKVSASVGHDNDTSHCYYCGGGVVEEEREFSFRNMDVFGGRVVCFGCQHRAEPQSTEMRAEYQR